MTDQMDITLHPIGRVRTGLDTLEDCPPSARSNPTGSIIDLDPAFADGLLNIELATHAVILYWFDRADRSALHRRTRPGEITRGVFASRSPNRPNPVALSVVKVQGRDGNRLHVSGLDCLDGTAVIDIKPYVPDDDCMPEAFIGWECGCTSAPSVVAESKEACIC